MRLDLLGESPRSRRVAALRARVNAAPPVARLLARVDEAIAAGDYQKYRGAYWTLLFLAELEADGRDERAQRLARHVLSRQLENGGFAPDGKWPSASCRRAACPAPSWTSTASRARAR